MGGLRANRTERHRHGLFPNCRPYRNNPSSSFQMSAVRVVGKLYNEIARCVLSQSIAARRHSPPHFIEEVQQKRRVQ